MFKVTSKSSKECVESTISQSIVVRLKVAPVRIDRMVEDAEKYPDEDEANESKYEAEKGLEKSRFTMCNNN